MPDQKMGVIGACMAQVDLGDPTPHCTSGTAYPAYFPGWSAAVANATTKEHEKLKGMVTLCRYHRLSLLCQFSVISFSIIVVQCHVYGKLCIGYYTKAEGSTPSGKNWH